MALDSEEKEDLPTIFFSQALRARKVGEQSRMESLDRRWRDEKREEPDDETGESEDVGRGEIERDVNRTTLCDVGGEGIRLVDNETVGWKK